MDPDAVLGKIFRIMENKGVLIIAVPNTRADGVFMKNIDWVWIQEPFVHLWHWSYMSLARLMEKNGYHIIKIMTRDTWDANPLLTGILGVGMNIK